jgi:hypothetical protein
VKQVGRLQAEGFTDVDDSWFVDRLNSSVSEWSGLVTRIEPSREDLAVAALRLESRLGNRETVETL